MATKSVEITFDKLNSLFKALEELDSDKKDYQITMKEFNLIKDKQDIIRNLIGNRKSDDWGQFKQSFIDFQSQYNITWTSSQGQGGPLNLNYIYLPYELGLSVAQDIINSKEIVEKKEYDLHEILKKNYLQIMYKYIDKNYSYIDLSDFKEGFKSYSKGNFSFKFKKGKGAYFKKTINEFVYLNKKESQDEIALGNL
ncbi:MAG: hypothetical protein KDK54_21865, partial [Leptospiraceae bacterium]|nr:hypothetical protein [Leptospiraceae bacterium]